MRVSWYQIELFHCPAETYPFISSKVDTMVTCSVAGFISVTDSTDFTNMNCLSKGFYCCSSEKQRDNRNVTAGATTVREIKISDNTAQVRSRTIASLTGTWKQIKRIHSYRSVLVTLTMELELELELELSFDLELELPFELELRERPPHQPPELDFEPELELELRLELEARCELERELERELGLELELELEEPPPHHPSHCPRTSSVRITTSNSATNVHTLMLYAKDFTWLSGTWSVVLMKTSNRLIGTLMDSRAFMGKREEVAELALFRFIIT